MTRLVPTTALAWRSWTPSCRAKTNPCGPRTETRYNLAPFSCSDQIRSKQFLHPVALKQDRGILLHSEQCPAMVPLLRWSLVVLAVVGAVTVVVCATFRFAPDGRVHMALGHSSMSSCSDPRDPRVWFCESGEGCGDRMLALVHYNHLVCVGMLLTVSLLSLDMLWLVHFRQSSGWGRAAIRFSATTVFLSTMAMTLVSSWSMYDFLHGKCNTSLEGGAVAG